MEQATAERNARPQQPETIRIQGFIVKSSFGDYRHTAYDPRLGDNKYGDLVLGEHVVEFEVPSNFNAVAAEIEALEAQVKAERLSCEQRVSFLTDRITKLQSIEMAPTSGAAS